MYKDEIKKIEHYRKKLIDRYREDGIILNNSELQQKIDSLDLKLAIFQQGYIYNGEIMNLEKFNEQKQDIYTDLKILYELMYETAKERLSKIQSNIKYNLNYLSKIAEKYKYRTALESIGLYGKNVYYKTNGFSQYYDNGNIRINLGSLNIDSGSRIACFLASEDFSGDEKVFFNFDNEYQVREYTFDRNLLNLVGEYTTNKYEGTITENTNSNFKVSPQEDFVPDKTAKYNLFIKKSYINVTSYTSSQNSYIEKNAMVYKAEEDCEISFYVYGASYINIYTNELYEEKSFENNNITTPKLRQKIHIKANQGFVLDIDTDGEIYADKISCYINDDSLYSKSGYGEENDKYMLEEIRYGKPVNFKNVEVIIKNAQSAFYDINYIMIKSVQAEMDDDF